MRARVGSHLALSAAGGLLLLFVALAGTGGGDGATPRDRVIVGVTLMVALAVGASVALRPNWGRGLPVEDGPRGAVDRGPPPGPRRRGHHPECGAFRDHTLTVGGRTRCAGCTGLAAGAALASALTLAYVLHPPAPSWAGGPVLVVTGTLLVALDLFAALAGGAGPWASLALNALMVPGFALVAIGLLESTGDPAYGLMGVVVSALWTDTRARISRRNHAIVCAACPGDCVAYV